MKIKDEIENKLGFLEFKVKKFMINYCFFFFKGINRV